MALRTTLRLVWMAVMLGIAGRPAVGAGFSASYRELAPSPLNTVMTWYSGAVTRDGKFLYGIGNSHNAYGNNGLWLYDPATDTHENIFPDTGRRWKWTAGTNKSGHWPPLAAKDKALREFFGGSTIRALTNRNNHQAFYLPARDEFWVLAGTTFYQSSPYFGGRFSLATKRWEYLSKPWGEKTVNDLADFSAGLIAGQGAWVAPNAATAVCADLNTVVLFGGMSGHDGVRIIEPNPAGPEPYRWASAPRPPFHQPAENVRHNAVCVGDAVYFVAGQERVRGVKCCRTPNPAPFWKFHVPSRTWTRLPDGPPGAYFTVITHDSAADALLVYGGSASNRLWVYDLREGAWYDLTGTVSGLPRADMHTGGFIPGFGHLYKGGRRFDDSGKSEGYRAGARMMTIVLRRDGSAGTPAARVMAKRMQARTHTPPVVTAPPTRQPRATRVAAKSAAPKPIAPSRKKAAATLAAAPAVPGGVIHWTRIRLPGWPKSPEGSMKHQRLVEGPGGRIYLLGGDWGGGEERHVGRQEVYSFDPLSPTGDWRQEAPYCGTEDKPVHWHTDEAGVAWDAKRGVFWKLAGTPYGPKDKCFNSGRSVKAKVITFDPKAKAWALPSNFEQKNLGYVTNGVMDAEKDEMVQITDTAVWHLSLTTGRWSRHGLPGNVKRFNVISTRLDRTVWWLNRNEQLESYDLDTHTTSGHGPWPFGVQAGWATAMALPYDGRVLLIWPTSRSAQPRLAAVFDPAKKTWTTLDMGDARGNTAMLHSSGRVVLMGGMAPPEDHNKFVWVGTLP